MSFWALVFLLMAAVSAAFGFGDIVPVSAGDAQALFFLFIALFVVSLVAIVVGKTTLR